MTTNPNIQRIQELCRRGKLKATPQRLEIYRQLASTTEHPSAETVFHRVRETLPTISLDTVYRTLASLEKIGAAVRVEAFGDKARFDADLTPHHHLVCAVCREITDFSWPGFEELPLPENVVGWGETSSKNAVIRGVCRRCREGARSCSPPRSVGADRKK
ncbi:MAG: Fur family transcriptional regulator [Pseudomonadota bacterium]